METLGAIRITIRVFSDLSREDMGFPGLGYALAFRPSLRVVGGFLPPQTLSPENLGFGSLWENLSLG